MLQSGVSAVTPDWGANNYQKYAHLYYTNAEVVTLPTTTKPGQQQAPGPGDTAPRSLSAEDSGGSVPYVSSIVRDVAPNTVLDTATSQPDTATPAGPVWKTLADFNLGASFLSGRRENKSEQTTTRRPIPTFGNFNFTVLRASNGPTPGPIIVKPSVTTPRMLTTTAEQRKSLVQSVITGELSWKDLVDIINKPKSTTEAPTTTTTPLFSTTPSPPPLRTTTLKPAPTRRLKPKISDNDQRTSSSKNVRRTYNVPVPIPRVNDVNVIKKTAGNQRDRDEDEEEEEEEEGVREVDLFHQEQLVSVLNRGISEDMSVPYVPPIMRKSAASQHGVGVLREKEELLSGEDALLSDKCTVLVIGEENGEPTYLAVCDEEEEEGEKRS